MARLPIPITPTGIVPPSKQCLECAVARQDAVEKTARKRTRKPAAETPQETSDAPAGEESGSSDS